jgi:hypothetical protein
VRRLFFLDNLHLLLGPVHRHERGADHAFARRVACGDDQPGSEPLGLRGAQARVVCAACKVCERPKAEDPNQYMSHLRVPVCVPWIGATF